MKRPNWVYWHRSLDPSKILELAGKEKVAQATTFNNDDATSHRRSKVAWLTGNQEVMDLLWPYVMSAADQMHVDVENISDFQYTEYHGSEGGKYDWHIDTNWGDTDGRDRKLSVTVQLSDGSDYLGGDFQFFEVDGPKEHIRDKGTVLIFPSYLKHRVTPVTEGVRKTLVAWFEGPSWR